MVINLLPIFNYHLLTHRWRELLARARKKTLQSIFYLVNGLKLPANGNKCKFGG